MKQKLCLRAFVIIGLLVVNNSFAQLEISAGNNQSTAVTTVFPTLLFVIFPDPFFHSPIPGFVLNYTILPGASGASGVFAGGVTTRQVTTGNNDHVQVTANSIAGTFTIRVTTPGDPGAVLFTLTNIPGTPHSVTITTGNNQSTPVYTNFPVDLTGTVRDQQGNLVPNGTTISFQMNPAANGAGCTFAGGVTEISATTTNGVTAPIAATANGIAGAYTVSGGVAGSVSLPVIATYQLANLCLSPSLTVTSNADSGPGTLRQALKDICTNGVITFAASVTLITLTSDQLLIDKPVSINGPGAGSLTISGNNSFRVFEIPNGINANISGMTIRDGRPAGTGLGGGGIAVRGGAIAPGIVNITGCIITNNNASASSLRVGGGIDNESATMTIDRCTIINNTTSLGGGGIQNQSVGASMIIRNSTIANNTAGTGNGGGIRNWAPMTITNCTIYGNSAQRGANVSKAANDILIGNTIIAGGILLNGGTIGPDLDGVVTSADYNLIQDLQGGLFTGTITHHIVGTDPNLLPLGVYGGPYSTLLPAPNSVVINAGNPSLVAGTDIRGLPRLAGTKADIGAVETNYIVTATSGTPQSAAIIAPFASVLQVRVSESGNVVRGVPVLFRAPSSGASGTFPGPSLIATTITNTNGIAISPVFTANNIAGTYPIIDSVGPAVTVANHVLTNTGGCVLTCPANITVNNDPGQCGAIVSFPMPTATGTCGAITASPASGSFFAKGTTTVTFTSSTTGVICTFTVTVNDTQAPTIICPANITVNNDPNQCGAIVAFNAPIANDNCPGIGAVITTPASGSLFTPGTTTVTSTVTDAVGLTSTCTFTITVNDTQAPTITCPANITTAATTGQCNKAVNYTAPTANDNCPGVTITSVPASGSVFPVGINTVTCTATDATGNSSVCSFTITVTDNQPPAITSQPVNKSICNGGNTSFTVTATNAVGYQWQLNSGNGFANIPNATSATLTLNNVVAGMNANQYRVIVNGSCTPVTSSAAVLNVGGSSSVSIAALPFSNIKPGQITILFATYDHAPASFTWYRNNNVSAITTQAVLPNIGIDSIGTYKVLFKDNNGCTAISGEVTILAEPATNLWIYPNPNDGHFQVRFYSSSSGGVRMINVYNSEGARVYQKQFTVNGPYQKMEIDIRRFAAGLYYVEVTDASGKKLTSGSMLYAR